MSTQEVNEYFASLPSALSDKELLLREALLNFLASWTGDVPPTVSQACARGDEELDLTVPQAKQEALPAGIALGRWIRERLGREIEIERTEWNTEHFHLIGQLDMRNVTRPEKKESKESADFFKSLPEDSFTANEDKLRLALLEFLDTWPNAYPPRVSDACKKDPGSDEASPVMVAKRRALAEGVKLYQWMERRIGGEVEVAQSSTGNQYFHRVGELNMDALPAELQ